MCTFRHNLFHKTAMAHVPISGDNLRMVDQPNLNDSTELLFFVDSITSSVNIDGSQALAGSGESRDFQLIKIPGYLKMKSHDFSGSACRV